MIAGDEVIQVPAPEGVGLQGEVLIRSEVVDPEGLGPRRFGRGAPIEEEDVRLHALGIEDAGRQSKQRVDVALMEELAPDRFACPTLEEGRCLGRRLLPAH